jgi:HlyD family secretion protein
LGHGFPSNSTRSLSKKHGDLVGRIDFISEDTFAETLLGQPLPVYRARVHIEEDQLVDLPPDFRLIPGMNVTGDIRTGERQIITYFIYPILRWVQRSLRET